MRKTWIKYGVLGLVAYLMFLLATFPAALAYSLVETMLPPQVKLYGLSGSLWQGKAEQVVVKGKQLESLRWDLDILPLLVGNLSADISVKQGKHYLSGEVVFSSEQTFTLHGMQSQFSVNELMAFMPIRLPATLEGTLTLKLDELEVEGGIPLAASGTAVWHSAAVKAPQRVELGDLRATFSNTEEGIKAVLSDGGGALKADGLLSVTPSGEYDFSGKFAARDQQQKVLAQSLRFFGTSGSDGTVSVNYQGRLPTAQ